MPDVIGENIKAIRQKKHISTTKLQELTGISQSTLSKLENGKRSRDLDLLQKIADGLEVSINRLLGTSINSLLDNLLPQKGETYQSLAQKLKWTTDYLENLDNVIPEPWDYENIEKIAGILGVSSKPLIAAFSLQEPPVYEGPSLSAYEEFSDVPYTVSEETETFAANREDGYEEDLPPEAVKELEQYKEFLRMKYKKKE